MGPILYCTTGEGGCGPIVREGVGLYCPVLHRVATLSAITFSRYVAHNLVTLVDKACYDNAPIPLFMFMLCSCIKDQFVSLSLFSFIISSHSFCL